MDFIEERIGEIFAQIVFFGITLTVCIGSSIAVISRNEMTSGPIYALLTGHNIPSGEHLTLIVLRNNQSRF